MFLVYHKGTTESRRWSFKNSKAPADDQCVLNAPMLFQDDAETHKYKHGLDVTELGQNSSHLYLPFEHELTRAAVQNFDVPMGSFLCMLV